MDETRFVLKLVKAGNSAEDVEAVLKHFWADGRLDMRSAAVQTAILKLIMGDLIGASREIEAKNKADKEIVCRKTDK